MRSAFLFAALASLTAVGTVAAQSHVTPAKATSRSEASRNLLVAVLAGAYNSPPVVTDATGTVELTVQGSRVHYQIRLNSIRDVTGVYLHIGQAGDNRPAVADLFEGLKPGSVSGVLASGTLERRDVHEATMTQLIRALRRDDAYVSVHTMAHPQGELRGQLRLQPVVAAR